MVVGIFQKVFIQVVLWTIIFHEKKKLHKKTIRALFTIIGRYQNDAMYLLNMTHLSALKKFEKITGKLV